MFLLGTEQKFLRYPGCSLVTILTELKGMEIEIKRCNNTKREFRYRTCPQPFLTHIEPTRFEVRITVETHIIVFWDVTPCSLLEGYESFTGFSPLSHGQHCRRRFVAQREAASASCPDYCRRDVRHTVLINSENERLVQC
jgi:hypothetical protein